MNRTRESVLEEIAGNLDYRRHEMTNLHRVLLTYAGKSLEITVVRMAIPMIYAHWEGYVKEVCHIYIEHIETSIMYARQLQPALLGYLWIPKLKPISQGGLNHKRRKAVAECVIHSLSGPVVFGDAEKIVDTSSNLRFSVLQRIADDLCLDITSLAGWRRHLDALVNLRNNIAHGIIPQRLGYSDFIMHTDATIGLMEGFEQVMHNAILIESFCQPNSRFSHRQRSKTTSTDPVVHIDKKST